jgi:hypothetical protein
MNAVPIPPWAAAAYSQNAIVIFYRTQLDFLFVVHSG